MVRNSDKKRGAFRLSFAETRTFVPTDIDVNNGDRTCMCEIWCRINIKEALSKIGVAMDDKIIDIIDRHIPVSIISYNTEHGEVKTERFVNERFCVVGLAKCLEEDEWNSEKGKKICQTKAKQKAFKKAFALYQDIFTHLMKSVNDVLRSMRFVGFSNKNEQEWLEKVLNS